MSQNLKMNITRAYIILMVQMLPFSTVNAADVCVAYTSGNEILASMRAANPEVRASAKDAIGAFIGAAKQQKKPEEMLRYFTKLDGSYDYARKALIEMPDMFSSYPGIESFEIDKAFSWGNYVVSWVSYSHQKGQAKLLETALCTNLCQMSNVFERPSEAVDLVSRYLYLIRTSEANLVSCPDGNPNFTVSPATILHAGNPLGFHFESKAQGATAKTLFSRVALGSEDDNIATCADLAENAGNLIELQEEELRTLVNDFLSTCTVNMSEKSLIPIVDMDSAVKRSYLTPVALLGTLGQIAEVTVLYAFNDKNTRVNILLLRQEDNARKLLLIPVIQSGGKALIDWAYYGGAAGELLSSASFARFVKMENSAYLR